MRQPSQWSLLAQRRFGPFFWTQFLGAFNDNVFKTALLTILTYDALSWTTLDPGLLNNLIPGLFILPFVLFSAMAGQFADKFEKSALARYVKLLEILLMVVAAAGWMTHNLWLLIASIAGMGLQSTLFGPVKYAYLPQHLKQEELVGGNGVVEMGTFVGILLGELLGAVLVVHKPWGLELVAFGSIGFAIAGWLFSLRIPHSPSPEPGLEINWNPITETLRNIRFTRQNRPVFLSVLANSWFWFYGAVVLAQLPVYTKDYLRGDHSVFVLLLAVFSVGIGTGSLLCERLSGHKVEVGLVPLGAFGLSLFGVDLYLASTGYLNQGMVDAAAFVVQQGSARILFDIVMIGVFGGVYVVPLFALIQTRCDRKHISRTIAGMNIMNALFMVVAALFAMALLSAGYTIPQIFLATALLNAAVALCIFMLVPEFLMRFLAWLLVHSTSRVKTVNAGHIPEQGAALLVCNHVSDVDAVIIMAASPRSMRVVLDQRTVRPPMLAWIFRTAKAIPVAPAKEDPEMMEKTYAEIAQALHEGDLVCLFQERKLTAAEGMSAFNAGIGRILERAAVPVIPIALQGVWGSLLARIPGSPPGRCYRRGPFSRLSLIVGQPLTPQQATPAAFLKEVNLLRGKWR